MIDRAVVIFSAAHSDFKKGDMMGAVIWGRCVVAMLLVVLASILLRDIGLDFGYFDFWQTPTWWKWTDEWFWALTDRGKWVPPFVLCCWALGRWSVKSTELSGAASFLGAVRPVNKARWLALGVVIGYIAALVVYRSLTR